MRRPHYTVMLIRQGAADDQLARVTRALYPPRNCGTTLHRKNAHGHGGAGALRVAVQLQSQTAYDSYGVLVDTDQHWTDVERALARQHHIVPIESHPCLEAVLLAVDSLRPHAQSRD